MTKRHITPQNGVNTVKGKKEMVTEKAKPCTQFETPYLSYIWGQHQKKKRKKKGPNNFTEPSKTGISERNEGYAQLKVKKIYTGRRAIYFSMVSMPIWILLAANLILYRINLI